MRVLGESGILKPADGNEIVRLIGNVQDVVQDNRHDLAIKRSRSERYNPNAIRVGGVRRDRRDGHPAVVQVVEPGLVVANVNRCTRIHTERLQVWSVAIERGDIVAAAGSCKAGDGRVDEARGLAP